MNTKLMRVHLRGLEINAQCGKGGVVNLDVRTQQKYKGVWERLRQNLANALFSVGDICHPSNEYATLRIVLQVVGRASIDDSQPSCADTSITQVWPIQCANGDAHYTALLVHEGVKRHHDDLSAVTSQFTTLRGQESTGNLHIYQFTGRKGVCI